MAGDLGSDHWREVASRMADGLVVLDPDGRCVWSDARAEALLGEHLRDPRGLAWLACDGEHVVPMPTGPRYVETCVAPSPEGYRTVTLRDVGERVHVCAELAQARAWASRARASVGAPDSSLAQGMLATVLVHELATPLTVLTLALDPLQGGDTLEGRPLDDVRAAVGHLERVVASLRGVGLRPRSRPTDLADVVDQALRLAGPTLLDARAEVRVRFEGPCIAVGERTRLVQVLTNLVLNAAHAVAERPGASLIRIETSEDEGSVAVDVHDDGVGIEASQLALVFEPFYTTKPAGIGTGIGLPLARRFVEDMGGALEITSERGVGTRARVRLTKC